MKIDMNDPRLTAYALGELDEREQSIVESLLDASPEARAAVEEIRRTAEWVESELKAEPIAGLTKDQRKAIESAIPVKQSFRFMPMALAASLFLIMGIWLVVPAMKGARETSNRQVALIPRHPAPSVNQPTSLPQETQLAVLDKKKEAGLQFQVEEQAEIHAVGSTGQPAQPGIPATTDQGTAVRPNNQTLRQILAPASPSMVAEAEAEARERDERGNSSAPMFAAQLLPGGERASDHTNREGDKILYPARKKSVFDVVGGGDQRELGRPNNNKSPGWCGTTWPKNPPGQVAPSFDPQPNTESYSQINDNPFLRVRETPLSTFSIDVDTASYANIRRFLTSGQLPPPDAVRIEEMINYFSYDYPQPTGEDPFSVNVDTATCPWQTSHRLLRVGLKGKTFPQEVRPPCNLVFLIDVSGSMEPENKLPLLKQAMRMLTSQLTGRDRVAIVVYAGNSGLVLPSTTCNNQETIQHALANLEAGGSTNGAAGIQLAYAVAAENFNKEGVNRVILCTDGDFNVGVTNQNDLVSLIEQKAGTGVFLSVFGFGMGNLKDATLEKLADKGNGNYGYIDTLNEAKKVFVDQLAGTLVTIAKDVKIQIEFNPAQAQAYRLIGYENRVMAAQDFNDDRKDAGEIGVGHTVTALYELVPPGENMAGVDQLKYQQTSEAGARPATAGPETLAGAAPAKVSNELLTVKLRYKQPDGATSKLIERPITSDNEDFSEASIDFRFAASVASFGMLLRNSPHAGNATFDTVLDQASATLGADLNGYRAEFVELVRKAKALRRS